MVVYEIFFSRSVDRKFWLNLKTNSHRQPLQNYLRISQKEVLFLYGVGAIPEEQIF